MSNTPNMYCKVFVDSEIEEDQLLDLIASITSGSIKRGTVQGLRIDWGVLEDL